MKKIKKICIAISCVLITLTVVACSKQKAIVGTYTDPDENITLDIKEDGSFEMIKISPHDGTESYYDDGTYEQLSDEQWLLMTNHRGKLQVDMTEEGDLFIQTAQNTGWEPAYYYKE